MNPIIELKDVAKVYKLGETNVVALNKVNLAIEEGEFLSIMGPSGSGKSTLLNIIGCIDVPTTGKVILDSKNVSNLSDRELTRIRLHNIGFIFQQFYLIPTLTAHENIEMPMKEAKIGKDARAKRTREILELVGLKERGRHYPNQLSGGEQQRVAIARALANQPKILLADEPTGELDSDTSKRIVSLLKQLNKEKRITVIIVTHDPNIAGETDRKIMMLDGKLSG